MKIFSKLHEKYKLRGREYILIGLILVLLGLVIGLLCSPKGDRILGNNNGNNNAGALGDLQNSKAE